MRRTAVREILIGASVGLIGGCAAAPEANKQEPQATPGTQASVGQTCRSGPDDCKKNRSALRCEVEVGLGEVDGQCAVTRLDEVTDKAALPKHQVQMCVGDTLTWAFASDCAGDVTVEIGGFRLTDEIKKRHSISADELSDQQLFRDLGQVQVRRGQTGLLTALVKTPYAPRTYKYDIVVVGPGGKRVLDPEGEIYR
jgi:hypothetical protein